MEGSESRVVVFVTGWLNTWCTGTFASKGLPKLIRGSFHQAFLLVFSVWLSVPSPCLKVEPWVPLAAVRRISGSLDVLPPFSRTPCGDHHRRRTNDPE
jgi:hypothetical protein